MLRFAESTHGDDPDLQELITDVKKTPEVRRIWEADTDFVEHRDGHVFLATVPTLDYGTIEIVSHVANPAIMPDCRFVVMTWVEAGAEVKEDATHDALGGIRDAWAGQTHNTAQEKERAQERITEADRMRAEDVRTSRLLVTSPEEATAKAGADGVPLPAVSQMMGRDAQLTLAPSTRSIIWAVEETPDRWGVTEVAPLTVLARLSVLNSAVEKGYFGDNPLNGLRWNAPAVNEEVDPAAVPHPAQIARLLTAVAQQRGRGPHLEAFFGCMYYAAMRPAEVIHLRLDQCHLPKTGWGMLNLSGGVVQARTGRTTARCTRCTRSSAVRPPRPDLCRSRRS